jgi:hypothetical protein
MDADLSHPVVSRSLLESEQTLRLLARPFSILYQWCRQLSGTLNCTFPAFICIPHTDL